MQFRTAALFAAGLAAAAVGAPAKGQNEKPAARPPVAATAPRVNVNQATAAQIAYLPRIGSTVATRVVEYRKAHGPFQRVEDLMEVKGIGEKLFLTVKPYVAVSGPTTLAQKLKAPRRASSPASASAPKPAPKPAAKPAASAGRGR